jgi:hypothetical protein
MTAKKTPAAKPAKPAEKPATSGLEKRLANLGAAVRMLLEGVGSEERWKEAYGLAGGKAPTDRETVQEPAEGA